MTDEMKQELVDWCNVRCFVVMPPGLLLETYYPLLSADEKNWLRGFLDRMTDSAGVPSYSSPIPDETIINAALASFEAAEHVPLYTQDEIRAHREGVHAVMVRLGLYDRFIERREEA
ncbi:MAG: hypothetical protein AAGE80_05490 [Pseudomonadota bacterium]